MVEPNFDYQFDTILDAVEDLGADPNGDEDVIPIIEDNYRSNTKIEFPPGTYLFGSSWIDHDSAVTDFGITGTGTSQRDVQFFVPDGRFNGQTALSLRGPKEGHLFGNFSIQLTRNGDRSYPMRIDTEHRTSFIRVEWLGSVADQTVSDKGQVLAVATTEQAGVNIIRDLTAGVDAPAGRPGYPDGRVFLRFDGAHVGEYVLENADIRRQGSSAFRLASAPGIITVNGGTFFNNDNTNIRFSAGDHPTKQSVVDGSAVLIDDVRDAAQAIHIDNSGEFHDNAICRNCDVVVTDATAGQPLIASPSWGDHGTIVFQNLRVSNEIPYLTIDIEDSGLENDEVIIEDSDFTGSGRGISVTGREGSVIRDSCFDMPNGGISGTIDTENISSSGCDQPDVPPTPSPPGVPAADTDLDVPRLATAVSTGAVLGGAGYVAVNEPDQPNDVGVYVASIVGAVLAGSAALPDLSNIQESQ